MRIGLIARCDSTGLGIQSKEFFDHIPCKALVIDFSAMTPSPSFNDILKPNYDWYPHQTIMRWGNTHRPSGDIPKHVIEEFVKDLDIVFAMETPYDYNIFKICKERGVKTILQLNYEFLDFPSYHYTWPDLFLAPSMWHYDDIPGNKKFLPVPVNTKHFHPIAKREFFVHNAGRPAVHDRNGTSTLIAAWRYIEKKIQLKINSQKAVGCSTGIYGNVNLTVDANNKVHYSHNYEGGVLIMPRKYGGLCLPVNEALAAEMPVIMPDISPNNTWLPKEWLIESRPAFNFSAKKQISVWEPDHYALAKKIEQFCDPDFYIEAVWKAREIKQQISWEALLPKYHETFNEVMK